MDNFDVNKLMGMLSKMDKKELEKGLAQASEILKNKNKDEILKEINSNNKKNN